MDIETYGARVQTRPAVFAFGSDLTEKTKLERYLEKDPAHPQFKIQSTVRCVLLDELAFVEQSVIPVGARRMRWNSVSAKGEFDEVIAF